MLLQGASVAPLRKLGSKELRATHPPSELITAMPPSSCQVSHNSLSLRRKKNHLILPRSCSMLRFCCFPQNSPHYCRLLKTFGLMQCIQKCNTSLGMNTATLQPSFLKKLICVQCPICDAQPFYHSIITSRIRYSPTCPKSLK